jgi:hypothetical protein
MRRRSGNNITFNDMLFNILLGFVILFVIAFLLINPITKRQDIPAKAEFMIVLEWADESYSDFDLWVQHDDDHPIGFNNKEENGLNLERDDLGFSNDVVVIDGEQQIIRKNREVLNIRGVIPGDYYINVHAYSFREMGPVKVKVTVIDVNPRYREAYSLEIEVMGQNYIARAPAFTIDAEGNITTVFAHTRSVVPLGRH